MNVYEAIAAMADRSQRGHASQLLFRAEAAARGYVPSTPEWPVSMDHVLIDAQQPHRLLRIEVKQSAQRTNAGGYVVELRGSQGIGGREGSKKAKERLHEYHKSVDVIAIFLPAAECWYLIPETKLRGKSNVTLRPDKPHSKFDSYKDAWHLIGGWMHEVGDTNTEVTSLGGG